MQQFWINYFKNDQALDRLKTWDRPVKIKPAAGQIPANIKSNKERIEHLAKASQQRHIIFQDLFLQFQKAYQETKQKERKGEQNLRELKEYIRGSLINKVKKSTIRKELLKRGWTHDVIENYL